MCNVIAALISLSFYFPWIGTVIAGYLFYPICHLIYGLYVVMCPILERISPILERILGITGPILESIWRKTFVGPILLKTLMQLWKKHKTMKEDFNHVMQVLPKINTKVHPLNRELCLRVESSETFSDAKKVIFTEEERPKKCVKFLNLNTLMLPKMPESTVYLTGY